MSNPAICRMRSKLKNCLTKMASIPCWTFAANSSGVIWLYFIALPITLFPNEDFVPVLKFTSSRWIVVNWCTKRSTNLFSSSIFTEFLHLCKVMPRIHGRMVRRAVVLQTWLLYVATI